MKTIDRIEKIDNSLNDLIEKIANTADESTLTTYKNSIQELKAERKELVDAEKENETHVVTNSVKNYLDTDKSAKDMIEIMKNNRGGSFEGAWKRNLQKNGVNIDDPMDLMPKKLTLAINTQLTRANDVFPLLNVTHAGAQLVVRSLESQDEAFIHIPGTEKPVQNATFKVSAITPRMIGKIQSLDEILKRSLNDFDEIFNVIVAELVQAIINKIVDLVLVEGSATDGGNGTPQQENGFISVLKEPDTDKVVHVDGSNDLSLAVETAVNSLYAPGQKSLIVTLSQRNALMTALRKDNPNVAYLNNNQTLAENFGVDNIVIYRGTKAIKPTVMVQNAYAVDMDPLTQVQAFEWKTNENIIQVETVATGRTAVFGGVAVIDVPSAQSANNNK